MNQEIFLTPAEQMRHIRNVVNAADTDETQDASLILAAYFSRLDILRGQIAIMEGIMLLREEPFTSHSPVIGPLIVHFRTLWNWLSTKWYILPIMKQQNDFNTALTKTLREMLTAIESLARSVEYMQAQFAKPETNDVVTQEDHDSSETTKVREKSSQNNHHF